jgi:hypothetical protein
MNLPVDQIIGCNQNNIEVKHAIQEGIQLQLFSTYIFYSKLLNSLYVCQFKFLALKIVYLIAFIQPEYIKFSSLRNLIRNISISILHTRQF